MCINLKEKMEKCKECGADLIGRIDKKFCSEGCRNSWHNRRCRDEGKEIRKINRILARNLKLLKEISCNKTVECPKEKMVRLGFDFSYFTSVEKDPCIGLCYFCYDFSYSYSKKDVICISPPN